MPHLPHTGLWGPLSVGGRGQVSLSQGRDVNWGSSRGLPVMSCVPNGWGGIVEFGGLVA